MYLVECDIFVHVVTEVVSYFDIYIMDIIFDYKFCLHYKYSRTVEQNAYKGSTAINSFDFTISALSYIYIYIYISFLMKSYEEIY